MINKSIHYAFILLICLIFCACAGNQEADENTTEEFDIGPSAPAGIKVLIWGFQELLIPAGIPLSEHQIAQIKEQYSPQNADEGIKNVMGLLTSDQKKIIVDDLKNQLKQLGYPLSRKQIKLYMNYGPKSTVIYINILTNKQKKALFTAGEIDSE